MPRSTNTDEHKDGCTSCYDTFPNGEFLPGSRVYIIRRPKKVESKVAPELLQPRGWLQGPLFTPSTWKVPFFPLDQKETLETPPRSSAREPR